MPGPFRIEVNDAQSRVPIDPDRLRAAADEVLRHEGVAAAEVSVALIDGETMRRLNRTHLGHDYDTDVLSFLLDCEETESANPDAPRGEGKRLDGEVLISTDVAARAAEEFRWSVENEVLLYLVHGLLHLVGYDDLTDDEKSLMRRRERMHLARWGLAPTYGDVDPHSGDGPASGSPGREPNSGVRG